MFNNAISAQSILQLPVKQGAKRILNPIIRKQNCLATASVYLIDAII
jgi:hypothetical protein